MRLPGEECDDCVPAYLRKSLPSLIFSSLPFIATFLLVAVIVLQKLFPVLSGQALPNGSKDDHLLTPSTSAAAAASRSSSPRGPLGTLRRTLTTRRLAALTFASNIGLAAVLAELILCEISDTLNPAARSFSIRVTLTSLLVLLILVTPALEFHTVITAAGWSFGGSGGSGGGWGRGGGGTRTAWGLEITGLSIWLVAFFYLGRGLLGTYLHEESYIRKHTVAEGCLERIGVIGVTLMASLAGFAAVSSLWQTFGVKKRLVTESDISRKQTGLDSTVSMLESKRSRLRALERKVSETASSSSDGFMTRVMGSIRGNPDQLELRTLRMEISGLEAMQASLANALVALRTRRATQARAHTPLGRALAVFSYAFALYCAYRIAATAFTTLRRLLVAAPTGAPGTSFASSDPINNVLALLVKHWDPSLDRRAWTRLFSFLLSGGMLLASFSAVLQTVLVFARLAPGLLRHAQANLALLVSQIAATYVISSALLLRSNLPNEVRNVVSTALGAPLEPRFVERWFEGWFLAASALTAAAIWVGRKVNGDDWDDDGEGGEADVELGKMS